MKKIINGKVYDTETAKRLAFATANCSCSDFSYWEEELYRKKTGEYFLYGSGGPMTKYAKFVDTNNWSSGEEIIPVTYQMAREWAEEHLEADEFIRLFGDPGEGDDTRQIITVSLPNDLVARIRREAEISGRTMSDVVLSFMKGEGK